MKLFTITFMSVLFLFCSCKTSNTITLTVASQKGDCVGVVPQKCLYVKKAGSADWEFFYNQIEGFNYQPGYEYDLKVKVEQLKNVPADASSLRYILLKEISKTRTESTGLPVRN